MPNNPFAIDIGNPLQGLGQAAQVYGQQQLQEKQLATQQAKQQEAQDVLASGDINLMANFMASNPQMAKGLEASFQFKDDATRKNMEDSAVRILQGEDPQEVIRDRAAFVSQQGGSPAQTLEALDDTPEETMQSAKIMLAALNPEKAKAVREAMATKQSKFAQGTGQMSGYAFDEETGGFTIDPAIKQDLEAKATAKAAEGTKLNAKDRQGINKDVTTLIKDSVGIVKAAKSLSGLKKSSSPAAQLAAVFSFMKAMDPSSTVRESEQGQVYNAQGAAKGIANKINALLGKGGLSEEGFKDLVDTASNLANSAIDSSSNEINNYLETYEDTLPKSFKSSLIKRIPSRIGGGKKEDKPAELSQSAMKYLGGQ